MGGTIVCDKVCLDVASISSPSPDMSQSSLVDDNPGEETCEKCVSFAESLGR